MRPEEGEWSFTWQEIIVLGLVLLIAAAVAFPWFAKSREISQQNACISNLRMIDSAKEQYAMANKLKDGDVVTWDQIGAYLKGGGCICPAARGEIQYVAGTGKIDYDAYYTIGPIGKDPACRLFLRSHRFAGASSGADDVYLPLHMAVSRNDTNEVLSLIKRGEPINEKQDSGPTPLHIAVHHNLPDMVKLLIREKAKINELDNNGYTPLARACENGHREIAAILIAGGADVNDGGKEGKYPVFSAVSGSSEEVLDLLITRGANISITNWHGYSPLHAAARYGSSTGVVAHLIKSGVPVNTVVSNECKNCDGKTALDFAIRSEQTNMVSLLISHGAIRGPAFREARSASESGSSVTNK